MSNNPEPYLTRPQVSLLRRLVQVDTYLIPSHICNGVNRNGEIDSHEAGWATEDGTRLVKPCTVNRLLELGFLRPDKDSIHPRLFITPGGIEEIKKYRRDKQ